MNRIPYRLFLTIVLSLALNGCGSRRPPTAIPETPTIIVPTPTPTASPTPTPIPTLAPYNKLPRQVNDDWQTASLTEAGINPFTISSMLGYIYQGDKSGDSLYRPNGTPKYQNIHAILIVKDGRLVFEEYFYDYYYDKRHEAASTTKSITSLLVGLAIEHGYLDGVDEPILPYFPEYEPLQNPDNRKAEITIEDLLTMRHGLECDDWEPSSPTYWKKDTLYLQPDTIAFTLGFPMEYDPGSHYSYCSTSTIVLGAVLSKASGMSIAEFSRQYLFDPMGITSYTWAMVPGGWTDTSGSMQMRPRDMARVGQMVLQNGHWNGKQIVPEDWIHQSTEKHLPLTFNEDWGNGYGYLWWLSDVPIGDRMVHSVSASGAGGQVITIYPELNMVIVITGGNYDNDEGYPFQIMQKFILPAVLH